MKRKYLAVMLGAVMTASMTVNSVSFAENTAAKAAADAAEDTAEEAAADTAEDTSESTSENGSGAVQEEDTIYGEVTAVDDTSITIDVGTLSRNAEGQSAQAPQKPSGKGGMGAPGGQGGPGASDNSSVNYSAAHEYSDSTDISGEDLTSTGVDENAALADGSDAEVFISDSTIRRDSGNSTGGDNASFYGVGAAALATDGTLYIDDSAITTDAKGGAGAFAYGDGKVYIADTTINTNQDTSGGVHVAGGGTLYAWDLDVTTNGESSAAIRSDRGSGTEVIDGGTYTSNGTGSPAIYSTADITVNDADLTANGSEAICIEGLNTIRLFDCDLTGNMPDQDQNDTTWNVIVYQSMSGDSEEGNGTFEMTGGTLTAKNGGMFYTTNTQSTITLKDVDITYSDDNPFFLQCTGNANQRGWGEAGNNGADCLFTAIQQDMEGNVIWDSISDLDFYITDASSLTGAFVNDETYAGNGGEGYANVYIDSTSTWTVTGDSTVTSLFNEGKIADEEGNTVSVIGTDGTVYVKGDSDYTITVASYSDSADMSGASSVSVYSDYAVEKPSQFEEA